MTRFRKLAPVVAIALLMPLCVAVLWTVTFGRSTPHASRPSAPAPASPGASYAPELVRIEPGTVVEETVPPGWSCRIIKTVMWLKSGDLDLLPNFASETATKLRTIVLADVRQTQRGYELRRLGIGLAMKKNGSDIVVSAESADRLGMDLSMLDNLVLSRADQALDRGRLAARTSTFAVYDASVELLQNQEHRSIYLRYAVTVDPRSGRIRTLIWPIAEEPAERKSPSEMILLPPNALYRCGVHVNAKTLLGNVPVAWFFAMDGLPPGERLPVPPSLRKWAILDPSTSDDSTAFEAVVRQALARPGSKLSDSRE